MRPYMLWLTWTYTGDRREWKFPEGFFSAVVGDWSRRLRENEWRGARA